jgi:predicted AlkP superfamily pyrophosphatase or phosphodiesterase
MSRFASHLQLVFLFIAVSWGAIACTPASTAPGTGPNLGNAPADTGAYLLMVSFDGFRWDYLDRGVTPNVDRIAARGVRAEGLVPAFPTKTFPNHYTMVTGLVPDHHGIVANSMYDPDFDATFSMSDRTSVQDGRWWGGVPVWVTAERHGMRTAPMFWAGSEAKIDGVSASYWMPFDMHTSYPDRVTWVLDKLDLPQGERPRFLTAYFEATDHVGHNSGPDSDEILGAIAEVDAALGQLLDGIESRGLTDRTDIIVVSDHGMSPTSRDRVMFVDDYVDLDVARPIDWNPVLALWPAEEDRESVYAALHHAHPHVTVYWKDSIPAEYEYGTHRRVAPIIAIADDGWSITTHPYYDPAPGLADGGTHGFDHRAPDMRGIFVAAGPSFKTGVRVPAFRNVHVYPLLMEILGLPAEPSDGDLAATEGILAE